MRARRCVVVRGTRESTQQGAIEATRALDPREVLWCGQGAPEGVRATASRGLATLLGQSLSAVVLDLHDAIDPDALARAEGMIRGGGALVLRLGEAELPARADFAVHPFSQADVGTRFAQRLSRRLPALDGAEIAPSIPSSATREQDALVETLRSMLDADAPAIALIVADRGRGKSAALGRAIAGSQRRIVVTAAREEALVEVERFAGRITYARPDVLARGSDAEAIVIDEAAQLPVALVKRIVLAHPHARIALATTCRGYEGTGRGFALRFATWARTLGRPLVERTSSEPIRWAAGDPLERWIFDALLLDAEPAVLGIEESEPRYERLDRDRLASDERVLRQIFGLLITAHYRTTPNDLARMLDAPNLEVHALFEGEDVVAVSLLAREGGLPLATAEAMRRGEHRIVGHALADTLVTHALRTEAAGLSMLRSVRIAVHDRRRGRGLARRLVEEIHAHETPDLFGTIFGATPELVRFRQALGYRVVRVGLSRGSRSGEPAVVMIRPRSPEAEALVASLREDLARELGAQLALQEADDGAPIDPALRDALAFDLPPAAELGPDAIRSIALGYATSTQPLDVVAAALERFVSQHAIADDVLRARLIDRDAWTRLAVRTGHPSMASAMRAARAAIARACAEGTAR